MLYTLSAETPVRCVIYIQVHILVLN